jgi:hypothetical protein
MSLGFRLEHTHAPPRPYGGEVLAAHYGRLWKGLLCPGSSNLALLFSGYYK